MLIELIATFVLGLAVAGVVMLLQRLARGRLPRWLMPAAAGLAMLTYQIWSEYAWFDRTLASLPPGMTVVSRHSESVMWRPWTYLVPQTNRFAVVDTASVQHHQNLPGQAIARILLFARYAPTATAPQLFDCREHRRADLADGAQFAADGTIIDAQWVKLSADDPTLRAVCAA